MVERIGTRYREYCTYRRDELQAARQETEAPGRGVPSASHAQLAILILALIGDTTNLFWLPSLTINVWRWDGYRKKFMRIW
jgi:hypothetical protein